MKARHRREFPGKIRKSERLDTDENSQVKLERVKARHRREFPGKIRKSEARHRREFPGKIRKSES